MVRMFIEFLGQFDCDDAPNIHIGIGWKNCRRLSNAGVINADNHAYFALGR